MEGRVPPGAPPECAWPAAYDSDIESLAPVTVSHFRADFLGPGESCLFLGCGVAPSGSLKCAYAGCRVKFLDAIEAPATGRPTMRPVALAGVPHLFLSYDVLDRTDIVKVQDATFQPAALAGFHADRASIAVGTCGPDCLVQVVASHVRFIGVNGAAAGRAKDWALADHGLAGLAINHAAVHGGRVVFSAGPHVRALEVSADGAARLAFELAEPEDISALHACTFPAGFPVSACVVAGLWNRNSVVFHPLEADERQVEIAELGEELVGGQPRAIAVASTSARAGAAGGHVTLVVGSITGAFTAFAIDRDLNVARTLRVSVGAAPVAIVPLVVGAAAAGGEEGAAELDAFYVKSNRDVLVTVPGPGRPLRAARVKAERAFAALAPFPIPGVAGGLVCAADGELQIAQLEPAVALQTDSLPVGDTCLALDYHAASGHLVALTESRGKRQRLRVVDAASLRERFTVEIDRHHFQCQIKCLRLPCTTEEAEAGADGTDCPARAMAAREYVCVTSFLTADRHRAEKGAAGDATTFSALKVYSLEMAAGRWALQLHGSLPLPSICYPMQSLGLAASGADFRPGVPNVVLGGHDAVLLMSVFVDEAETLAKDSISNALDAVRLSADVPPELEERGAAKASDGAAEAQDQDPFDRLLADIGKPWQHRLAGSVVQRIRTGSSHAVAELAGPVEGGAFVAQEFFGSCVLLRGVQTEDRSATLFRAAATFAPGVYVACVAVLSARHFALASARGISIVERDPAAEEAFLER